LRFKRSLKGLDQAVYAMIAQRRQAEDLGEDLLGMFLKARDKETGQPMSDREVRDEILTMLIAGHETVASALTWTWYLLSLHPEARRRLRAEVLNAIGERPPASIDLEKMPFTDQVFSEALRLFPPAWIITRRAEEEDAFGSYRVSPGSLVIISPYVVHRLPEYWKNPLGFDPDRFHPGEKEGKGRFSFIPFGGGPRLCIGNQFAVLEARLILAMVIQKFRLDLLPAHAIHVESLVTLRPRGGLPMRVYPWQMEEQR
jgi:cytochrome P450